MLPTLILKNVWGRRTRSLLTVVGIGISVAVIIAFFALATSLKKELGVSVQITQADLIATQRGLAGPAGGSIPESCVQDIEGYEGVDEATGFLMASLSLPGMTSFNLFGVCPEDRDLYLADDQVLEGTHLRDDGDIVLGRMARRSLGLDVGDTLDLESGESFRVTGVYGTGNAYLDSGGMVSLGEAQQIAGREGKVTLIAVYTEPGADQDEVIERIEAAEMYLTVTPSSQVMETFSSIEVVNISAWVFYVVAAIMAGVGVVNVMFMSVSERMREIGILRAMGWSPLKVMKMILGESVLLSLAGFVVGSLLGTVAIWLITTLPSVRGLIIPTFGGYSFAIGLGVALLLGLVGGALPACWASRVSPAEALRHE